MSFEALHQLAKRALNVLERRFKDGAAGIEDNVIILEHLPMEAKGFAETALGAVTLDRVAECARHGDAQTCAFRFRSAF